MIEKRKIQEKEYHNLKRDEGLNASEHVDYEQSQRKWYSITRRSVDCYKDIMKIRCPGATVLDYGCGNGEMSFQMEEMGSKQVYGIDISDVSIENARVEARRREIENKMFFTVMDAEKTEFGNGFFDLIFESGVLHHLDLGKAYAELSRILHPNGRVICNETLGHNPVIHYYRKKTPNLRTEWEIEHILRKDDIMNAKKYFGRVEIAGFFHLATIAAVPFRNSAFFTPLLSTFEAVDSIILTLPGIRWYAWQAVFILSEPLGFNH